MHSFETIKNEGNESAVPLQLTAVTSLNRKLLFNFSISMSITI